MSTYLDLCKRLRSETDIPGVGPGTVAGQTGQLLQLVEWIARAYVEIQNRHGGRWRWLRHTASVTTTASVGSYAYSAWTDADTVAPIDRFTCWQMSPSDPPKCRLASSTSEWWLVPVKWDDWKRIYLIGTQNPGSPAHITVDPQNVVRLGPAPADQYVVTQDYFRGPQVLAVDDDTPEMPSQFHDLIVFRALEKYAADQSAPELMLRAEREGKRLLRQLDINQGPEWGGPCPLVR